MTTMEYSCVENKEQRNKRTYCENRLVFIQYYYYYDHWHWPFIICWIITMHEFNKVFKKTNVPVGHSSFDPDCK